MTDPIPTMSETGTTWTRAKFLAEIADLPQLAKYVPPYGPMPGVPIADVVAMLREVRIGVLTKAELKTIKYFGDLSYCDSECWGRCQVCPDDNRRDVIAIIARLTTAAPNVS